MENEALNDERRSSGLTRCSVTLLTRQGSLLTRFGAVVRHLRQQTFDLRCRARDASERRDERRGEKREEHRRNGKTGKMRAASERNDGGLL